MILDTYSADKIVKSPEGFNYAIADGSRHRMSAIWILHLQKNSDICHKNVTVCTQNNVTLQS